MAKKKFRAENVGKAVSTIDLRLNALVSVPIKLYSSTDSDTGTGMNLGCPKDLQRITRPAVCPVHGLLPAQDKPVSIVVVDENTTIKIEDSDLQALELPTKGAFVVEGELSAKDAEALTPYTENLYYTVPETDGANLAYSGIHQTLLNRKSVLVGKFTLRSNKELLGIVRPFQDTLVISVVPFMESIRPVPSFDLEDIDEDLAKNFGMVFDMLNKPDIAAMKNEWAVALEKRVEEKVQAMRSGKEAPKHEEVGMKGIEGRAALDSIFAEIKKKKAKT